MIKNKMASDVKYKIRDYNGRIENNAQCEEAHNAIKEQNGTLARQILQERNGIEYEGFQVEYFDNKRG